MFSNLDQDLFSLLHKDDQQIDRGITASEKKVAIEMLLRKGGHITARDELGETLLMRAIRNGHSLIVIQYLLRRGTDVFAVSHAGETAFSLAQQRQNLELIKLLASYIAEARANVATYQQLAAVGQKNDEQMNQDVIIEDMIVRLPENKNHGEHTWFNVRAVDNKKHSTLIYCPAVFKNNDNVYPYADFERLIDHIQLMAKIANQQHLQKHFYADAKKELKMNPASVNRITRLLTKEFSFYTAGKPLCLDQYGKLVATVEQIAKTCQPNLHLCLSSFPVQIGDTVFNYTLYVQCGENPKITPFTKAHASNEDDTYHTQTDWIPNFHLYDEMALLKKFPKCANESLAEKQQRKKQRRLEEHQREKAVLTVTPTGETFPHQNVLIAETAGGAKFNVAVDMCRDHLFARAKQILNAQLEQAAKGEDLTAIPEQISYIVTEHDIRKIVANRLVADYFVHVGSDDNCIQHATPVDLVNCTAFKNPNNIHQHTKPPHNQHLETLVDKNKYPYTQVFVNKRAILVNAPPFGAYYEIVLCPALQLSRIAHPFQKQIRAAAVTRPTMLYAQYPHFFNQPEESKSTPTASPQLIQRR